MRNVETKKTGNKLTIEIDLSKEYGYSKSGKTIIVASTDGNIELGDGMKLGLNCYKVPPAS